MEIAARVCYGDTAGGRCCGLISGPRDPIHALTNISEEGFCPITPSEGHLTEYFPISCLHNAGRIEIPFLEPICRDIVWPFVQVHVQLTHAEFRGPRAKLRHRANNFQFEYAPIALKPII